MFSGKDMQYAWKSKSHQFEAPYPKRGFDSLHPAQLIINDLQRSATKVQVNLGHFAGEAEVYYLQLLA